jgi:hypothetical protein
MMMMQFNLKWASPPPDLASRFTQFLAAHRKDFYDSAMNVVIEDITRGIVNQVDITGGSFPALEPETIRRKGHSMALIDKGLLYKPSTYSKLNQHRQDRAEIGVKPVSKSKDTPRNEVGEHLQINGVKSKSGLKKFYFFGISRDAEATILGLHDILVDEALRYAASGK